MGPLLLHAQQWLGDSSERTGSVDLVQDHHVETPLQQACCSVSAASVHATTGEHSQLLASLAQLPQLGPDHGLAVTFASLFRYRSNWSTPLDGPVTLNAT